MSVAIITYLCVPGNVFHLEEQLILMEYWTSNQKKKKKITEIAHASNVFYHGTIWDMTTEYWDQFSL